MFEFLSYAATGPALSLQILSENVSDPPTLIPLLLLLLFILSRLPETRLHQCGGPENPSPTALTMHCFTAAPKRQIPSSDHYLNNVKHT